MQYGCGISSRSAVGTWLVTKTMPRIAIGSQGCPYWGPGVSREAVFIDFHRLSSISIGFWGIWACGGQAVSQPVAACGPQFQICPTPFRMLQSVCCTLQYFHRFSSILGGFRASWGRRFQQPVAACGARFQICPTPFRMLQSVSCTLQYR